MKLTTVFTFGGVGSLGAAAHLATYGDLGAAAVVAGIGSTFLFLSLWGYGMLPEFSSRRTRRVVPVGLAALVLLAVVANPATAALGFQDCDPSDSLIGAFISSFTSPNDSAECRFNPDDPDSPTDHADHYAMGQSMETNTKNYLTGHANYQDERRQSAWTEAKLQVVNDLNSGVSETNATTNANETVADYMSTPLNNTLTRYSSAVSQLEYSWKANNSFVKSNDSATTTIIGFADLVITLPNGNQTHVRTVLVDESGSDKVMMPMKDLPADVLANSTGGDAWDTSQDLKNPYIPSLNNNTDNTTWFEQVYDYGGEKSFMYTSPDGSDPDVEAIPGEEFATAVEEIAEDNDADGAAPTGDIVHLQENLASYVPSVYATYNQSELNVTDVLAPSELASRASGDYNSTGYYSFASIEAAALGVNGNLNASVTLNYTANGTTETYTGDLFYTADDVGTFTNGTTYNATSLNGTAIVSYSSENGSGLLELTPGNFTIISVTNPVTGESMNGTTMQEYVDYNTDATTLQEDLNRTAQLREELEDAETASGGGSGMSSDAVLVLVGAVVALLLVGRGGR